MHSKLWGLLLTGLFAISAKAEVQRSFTKEIDYILSESMIEHGFAGNIRISKGKYVIYEKSIGMANLEHDVPHKPQTKFLIASVSKMFTAALILKLEDEGRLSTNDSIADHLDRDIVKKENLPAYWRQLRIHDLLTHTSGATRDIPQVGQVNVAQRHFLGSLISAIFTYDTSFSKNQSPGTDFSYSNVGYVLLAAIVENVCHKSFESCLEDKLLKPLQLINTGIYHRLKILKDQAEGYYRADGSNQLFRRCCIDSTNHIGSHSMYSTTTDLTTWNQFIHSKQESEILSLRARKKLTSAWVNDLKEQRPQGTAYGYGLFLDSKFSIKRVWHDGNTSGYLSLVSYLPEKDLSIVILNNYHGLLYSLDDFYNMKIHDRISEVISQSF